MSIKIKKVQDGYMAEISPPHCQGNPWQTTAPLSVDSLVQELLALGCHQTDIGDAFYEADPSWLDH